jgi:uncharacterized protein (DUF4213/DUF364 family)
MILNKTYELLKTRYKSHIEKLEISDVRVGVHLTAVKLSDDSSGVASTLPDIQVHCIKEHRDFGDFTPSKIKGQKVIDLLETAKNSGVIDTLKIAALNAISSKIISNSDYRKLENTDPIEFVPLDSQKTITIVGGFHSYIRKISPTNNKLYVLELNGDALSEEHRQFYVPAADFKEILPISDIIIITGLTLVNNTIDGLLSAIPSKALVIVTGPSSSIIPDILFENKVNIIGATRITNPDLLFTIVGEAGAGFHLFQYCAQKICILNE